MIDTNIQARDKVESKGKSLSQVSDKHYCYSNEEEEQC
jgi:hypothetical protein